MKLIAFLSLLALASAQFGPLPVKLPDVTLPPIIPTVSLPPAISGAINALGDVICAPLKLLPGKFGGDLVTGVCNMAKNWLNGIQKVIKSPLDYRNILSKDQQKYWDSIVNCASVQCVCDFWPNCSDHKVNIVDKLKSDPNDTLVKRYGRVVRKDIRAMTDPERNRFFYAMNKLRHDRIDGLTKWDILTAYHFFIPFAPAAHFSAGVLPFHRELLKNLEVALRYEHPLATFALWDTRLDAEMNNPRDSIVWSSDLLGSGQGNVSDGPFASFGFPNFPNFPGPLNQLGLSRAVGAAQAGVLLNREYVDIVLGKSSISELVFCRDPFFDTVHAATHIYLGGSLADPATSPSDAIFYLLHAFMDSIWEQWRQKHQSVKERESDIASPCIYNPFDDADKQLYPFSVKVKDAYSNKYTDEFYTYQEEPTCANKCHDSKYLVCKESNGRCMSKVVVGGDCSGLEKLDACFNGKCQGGKCVKA